MVIWFCFSSLPDCYIVQGLPSRELNSTDKIPLVGRFIIGTSRQSGKRRSDINSLELVFEEVDIMGNEAG